MSRNPICPGLIFFAKSPFWKRAPFAAPQFPIEWYKREDL